MEHGFYHPDRGYWQTTDAPSDAILRRYPSGTVSVPLKPSQFHEWTGTAWVENTDAKAASLAVQIRAERDRRLAQEVDPIAGNALRWAALTDAQRQEWADYRQSLLDVPQQQGFPSNVVWPTKPE